MFVVLFFLLFAPCGLFLHCDLAVNKVIVYLCITNSEETKEHPCTEIFCLFIHVGQEMASVRTSQSPLEASGTENWFYLYLYSG